MLPEMNTGNSVDAWELLKHPIQHRNKFHGPYLLRQVQMILACVPSAAYHIGLAFKNCFCGRVVKPIDSDDDSHSVAVLVDEVVRGQGSSDDIAVRTRVAAALGEEPASAAAEDPQERDMNRLYRVLKAFNTKWCRDYKRGGRDIEDFAVQAGSDGLDLSWRISWRDPALFKTFKQEILNVPGIDPETKRILREAFERNMQGVILPGEYLKGVPEDMVPGDAFLYSFNRFKGTLLGAGFISPEIRYRTFSNDGYPCDPFFEITFCHAGRGKEIQAISKMIEFPGFPEIYKPTMQKWIEALEYGSWDIQDSFPVRLSIREDGTFFIFSEEPNPLSPEQMFRGFVERIPLLTRFASFESILPP